MRALVQRVSEAGVSGPEGSQARIGSGLVILLGITHSDTDTQARYLADKCAHLRIFADENGKMNRSILEIEGEALVVSQFTLYGNTRKGRRPSFVDAAAPETAEPLYEGFVTELRQLGVPVQTGSFGVTMRVDIHNDGPVTLLVESPE